jgi:hypothetical protein
LTDNINLEKTKRNWYGIISRSTNQNYFTVAAAFASNHKEVALLDVGGNFP